MKKAFLVLSIIMLCGIAHAEDLAVPHVFVDGTPTVTADVNDNFAKDLTCPPIRQAFCLLPP